MRFILGLLFGLILGGLVAMVLAAQQTARQPDDSLIFGDEPRPAGA